MLRFLQIAKEHAEVDEAGGVGLVELHAAGKSELADHRLHKKSVT